MLFCVNQSEVSIILCQPIRDDYYHVSTNQRLVLSHVNQSESALPVLHHLTRCLHKVSLNIGSKEWRDVGSADNAVHHVTKLVEESLHLPVLEQSRLGGAGSGKVTNHWSHRLLTPPMPVQTALNRVRDCVKVCPSSSSSPPLLEIFYQLCWCTYWLKIPHGSVTIFTISRVKIHEEVANSFSSCSIINLVKRNFIMPHFSIL